jgi:hypothetical protein
MQTTKSSLIYRFADGNGEVEIQWVGFDGIEKRHTYQWTVRPGNGAEFTGADLRSGSGDPFNLSRTLGSLLSFLGAFAEARQYGSPQSDNWHSFPTGLAAWAVVMPDELTMAQQEIEGELA